MTDEANRRPPVETIPSVAGQVSAIASANAPFIYFDAVASFGLNHGIANITLEVIRFTSVGKEVLHDRVAVAHLRMGPLAVQSLKEAINSIELIARPTSEGPAN